MCEILGVTYCDDNKSFGKSVKFDENTIIVTIKIGKIVIKTKALGSAAWGMRGCVGCCYYGNFSFTSRAGAVPAGAVAVMARGTVEGTAAFSVLGTAAVPAIMIGCSWRSWSVEQIA
jgi:hypothetical protein